MGKSKKHQIIIYSIFVLCLIQARVAISGGKCNGSILQILFNSGKSMQIDAQSYTKGYLTTTCDEDGSDESEFTSATISKGGKLTLYAHEDNGSSQGTLQLTIMGRKGPEQLTLEYYYRNTGGSCKINPVTVTTSTKKYRYYCNYKSGAQGNCTTSSGLIFQVVDGNWDFSC